MGAQRPEDIHHLFSSAFNEGNVDAIIALYEPEGALIPQPGQVTRGHTAIRHALAQFLALKGTMQVRTVFVIHGTGIALLRGQWTLTGTGPDGSPVRMVGQSVEIARQQPTGDWLLAIDHPFGAD
jgi:uncharacterized protein (TIGR02246 family)